MTDQPKDRGKPIPSGRVDRMLRFGGMAGGIAARAAATGAAKFVRGERPTIRDVMLTPSNAARVADELANLRGAAMKIGQILSMDASEFIPREFADVLARLRAEGTPMTAGQLRNVLDKEWGRGWLHRFKSFDPKPVAAASIGQVHRAVSKAGEPLAVKVQFPGVKESIDSDVDNVLSVIKLAGVLPKDFDISAILAEAKTQLHQEADYQREAAYMARFGDILSGSDIYSVPRCVEEFTTERVLVMSYHEGDPIEALETADQAIRDKVVTDLFDLLLRELFDFGVMQTDPNFANYLYDTQAERIVLLDFGAARDVPPELVALYQNLLRAAISTDREALMTAAAEIKSIGPNMPTDMQEKILDLIIMATEPLRVSGVFDFGESQLAKRVSEAGMELSVYRDYAIAPDPDVMFIQRKIGGMFLLAARLNARVAAAPMVQAWLSPER